MLDFILDLKLAMEPSPVEQAIEPIQTPSAESAARNVTDTLFDNEISLRYKWAQVFGYPSKYVLVQPASPEDPYQTRNLSFTPIYEELVNLREAGLSLADIYDTIHDLDPEIVAHDVAMFYVFDDKQRGIPSSETLYNVNAFYRSYDNPTDDETETRIVNDRFPEETRLEATYDEWKAKFSDQVEKDRVALERIEAYQGHLLGLTPVRSSPVVIDGITVSVSPVLTSTGQPPTISDGIDIFNDSVPSLEVPYIQYNEDELPMDGGIKNKYYKIYRGETAELAPKLPNILPSPVKTNRKNRIYMTIWTDDTADIRNTKKDSYQSSVYILETNSILISSPVSIVRDETASISSVATAFPTLELGPATEVKVRGQFYLYDFEITDYSLVHLILNAELMSNYLYVEETTKSFANKKRLNIRYKSLLGESDDSDTPSGEGYILNKSSVRVKLKQKYIVPGDRGSTTGPPFQERLEDGSIVDVSFPDRTPYVEVRITEAESRDTAEKFVKVFTRLMDFYRQYRDDLNTYYEAFVPGLRPIEKPAETPRPVSRVGPGAPPRHGEKKIRQLQEAAPDIFITRYARECQLANQPTAISPDEIEMWKQNKIMVNDRMVERQVMPFPPNDPKVWLVCANNDVPYPGVKENKMKENNEQYKYIPCCFKTNHMDPTIRPNSKYQKYLRMLEGKAVEPPKAPKAAHRILGNKLLLASRYGSLPRTINDLLARVIPDNGRWGVAGGVNSFIHCVLEALDIPEYVRLTNMEDKELYAIEVRRALLEKIDTSVYRQELYDYNIEEIRLQIANPELFFDPNLYYRGLEELYNINIFTFIPSEKDDTRESGHLEIPRFKTFHAQPLRDYRRTVLIYKHTGGKNLEMPQCELIVSYNEDTRRLVKVFDDVQVTQLLYNTMMAIGKTLTCTIENQPESTYDNDLVVRANIYSTVDFFSIIQRSAIGQILDSYGKVRAFIFETTHGRMTIAFPPGQPENVPIAVEPVVARSEDVISVFGDPIGVTRTVEGLVDGYWYRAMDIMFGVYVPIIPIEDETDLPLGPVNPIMSTGLNVVERVKKLQRDLSILLQLVKWLFVVAQVTAPVGPDGKRAPVLVTQFDAQYMTAFQGVVEDSAEFYDFSQIPRKLPIVTSVEGGIAWGSSHAPSLFSDGKIVMYNENFRKKIADQLREFYILMSPLPLSTPSSPLQIGSDWTVPTEIEGLLMDAEDFKSQFYVLLFVGERDFNTWLKTINLPNYNNITIKDKLDIAYGNLEEAYLYVAPDKKIYMIQNVRDGSFERAITVAYYWNTAKINLGMNAAPFTDTLPVYAVYGISTSSTPVVIEDNTGKNENYLQVLRYGSLPVRTEVTREDGTVEIREEIRNLTAAMLPLL